MGAGAEPSRRFGHRGCRELGEFGTTLPSGRWRRGFSKDVDPVAVEIAQRNLRLNGVDGATALVSDGFSDLSKTGFTKILCNPHITSISRFRSG